MERHVYPQTVVSVSKQYKHPVQSGHQHHYPINDNM